MTKTTSPTKSLLNVLLFTLSLSEAGAQIVQQGPKLLGSGAVGAALQGNSVSLSADGNTALVGGFSDNRGIGAAWVFTRSAGVWTQQGGKLVGTGAEEDAGQGWGVALSGDGNTALVGGPTDGLDFAGAAWIWTRSGGVWTQQGSKLVPTDKVGNSEIASQGRAALSFDGNTAIVGGVVDTKGAGAAWIFTRSNGVWTQQGSKLVGTGAGPTTKSYTGIVSLSADGNTAAMGVAGDDNGTGTVWIWIRSGSVWTQQGPKLVGTGATRAAGQGVSVSLSADGNTALVSGPFDGVDSSGAVWVWSRSAETWKQMGEKLVTPGIYPRPVSLSADGGTALAAGFGARRWTRSGETWTLQEGVFGLLRDANTSPNGPKKTGNTYQWSFSVSQSADGKTALIGVVDDQLRQGGAMVFSEPTLSAIPKHSPFRNLRRSDAAILHLLLRQKEHVRITLYDGQGRSLARLMDGTLGAGAHSLAIPADMRGVFSFIDYRAGQDQETLKSRP